MGSNKPGGSHGDDGAGDHDHGHAHNHGNHHHHGSHHAHPGLSPGAAFRWSIVLNSLLTGLQLAIGFGFGSLALVGDALHNLGDVVGLALGWGAERLSQRPPRGRFTYGFGRSTQLASLLNGALTFAAGAVVVVEALQRFLHPVAIQVGPVALAAAAGIVINLLSARLFGHNHHHDLNQRAAVLHLLTDAAVSVAVLLSALLVGASGWLWLDALTAIAVGGVVMASAWGLLKEALAVSLDAVPAGIDLAAIEATLRALPGTLEVQALHVWGISSSRTALTARLLQLEQTPYDGNAMLQLAQERLNALGIDKVTLQVETVKPHSATR
jgi:cobalt-zinc-cadmium efflux system protein